MKPWPLYNIFEEVYAKDRAIGVSATTVAERLKELEQSTSNNLTQNVTLNDIEDMHIEDNMNDISDQEGTTRKASRKRKLRNKDIESMHKQFVEMIDHVIQDNNKCVSGIINAFKDDKYDRNRLDEELRKIPGLSINAMTKMTELDVCAFYAITE